MSNILPKHGERARELQHEGKNLWAESDETMAQVRDRAREATALRETGKLNRRRPVIHVVDDDEDFRVAIMRLLRAAGYETRGYKNAGDFLLAKFEEGPGCILMDVRMPGPSGLELQETLARREEHLPVIFISGYGDVPGTVRAMKAGAADFLTKPIQREVLLGAITDALARESETRALRKQMTNWRACYNSLTPREAKVFEGVVSGKMNKEIASELGAAERTIKAHRARVMDKMQAGSLAQLVRIADQLTAAMHTNAIR